MAHVQGQDYTLAGGGVSITDTTITLVNMKLPSGVAVTMADFGTIGYGTFEPETDREENISFTGITQNANGTAVLTGVVRGLKFVSPYDQDVTLRQPHAGGSRFRISNSVQFYDLFPEKAGTNVFTGSNDFTAATTTVATPTLGIQAANKDYVDGVAIAGVSDADTAVKGVAEQATLAEINADTGAGGTGAALFSDPATLATSKYGLQLPTADEKAALAGTGTPAVANPFVTQDTLNGFLTGMVMPYAGATAPTGWLLCDGGEVNRVTYATLFALIATTYGVGDGVNTFNVPDLRGRMPIGADNMGGTSANRVTNAQADTLGGGDGAETHTLIEAELPSHSHVVPGVDIGGTGFSGFQSFFNVNDSTDRNTSSVGSDQAHNNMPPYITLNYIIRT